MYTPKFSYTDEIYTTLDDTSNHAMLDDVTPYNITLDNTNIQYRNIR